MSSSTKCPRHWKLRAAAAFVAVSQLVVPFTAIAQMPSASSVISSQATASYKDFDGVLQTATSNLVQTTIQQVGAFTVSAGLTKSGAAGSRIAVMHTITNTGNGSDTFKIEVDDPESGGAFTSIDVFADVDANGQADNTTSLLSGGAVTAGATGTTNDITIGAGESYNYVVVYAVPVTAPSGWLKPSSVKVTAGNTGIDYAPQFRSETDTIRRADDAAFTASLTHSAPQVAAATGTWGATPNSGVRGTGTTYTFTYTNNGSAAGQIYLRDVLPTGLTYQADTAVWSSQPGVALANTGTFGAITPIDKIAFKVTGQTVEALIKDVPAGSSGTVSFKVVVDSAATFGPHASAGLFSNESCTAADLTVAANGTGCGTGGTSNLAATFTVLPERGVQLGPEVDTTPGTPASAADSVTVTSMVAGGVAMFPIPLRNTGADADTFKMTVDQTGMTFPAGTQFTWLQDDGVTPLQNSGGSDVDTGLGAAAQHQPAGARLAECAAAAERTRHRESCAVRHRRRFRSDHDHEQRGLDDQQRGGDGQHAGVHVVQGRQRGLPARQPGQLPQDNAGQPLACDLQPDAGHGGQRDDSLGFRWRTRSGGDRGTGVQGPVAAVNGLDREGRRQP